MCISFAAWMPHALLAALAFGVAVGTFVRFGLDYAELAAYRRISRAASGRGRIW
jgi:hypothetical protein